MTLTTTMWLWYGCYSHYSLFSTGWSSLYLLTYLIAVLNHYSGKARNNQEAKYSKGKYDSLQWITELACIVRNSKISGNSWIRLKNRWPCFWAFHWKRSAVMSRARGPYPCMLSGSYFFWSQGWPWKTKEKKYVGIPRNVQRSAGKNVRPGNSTSEISAGLSTELSVKASHRKTGVKRWKFVAPARSSSIFAISRNPQFKKYGWRTVGTICYFKFCNLSRCHDVAIFSWPMFWKKLSSRRSPLGIFCQLSTS